MLRTTTIGAAFMVTVLAVWASAAEATATPTPDELFGKGRDALFKGDYKAAIAFLSEAVEADTTKNSYRLHLARAYRYAGEEEKAREITDKPVCYSNRIMLTVWRNNSNAYMRKRACVHV